MRLYRFSPIEDLDSLIIAAGYVGHTATRLSELVVGEALPITYLTVCAHYEDEYARLSNHITMLGEISPANNGVQVMLNDPIRIGEVEVRKLRLRLPDPYRMQVGACDYAIDDYETFKSQMLPHNPNLRLIQRENYQMIEFFHPDFDVLSYVVSA